MRWEFSAEKILLKVVWKEERWQDVFALAHNKDSADHPAGPPVPAFEESAQPTLRMQRLCRLAHRAVVRPCIACFLVLLLQCVGGVGEIQSSNENTAAINLWRVIARIYTLKSKCKLERNQTKICVGSNKLARAGANKNLTLDIALHAGLNRVHGVRQRGCNNASPNTPNKLGSPRRPSFALGVFFCVFF